ncbi:hypothetical protein [Maribacter sp. 2210JD10-5]|uniref:hypothetical protein n=1 Tax=Maribacter sp. 2210JD10-5 TaxID=3386272 RepID=UPI0039BD4879
MTTERTLAFERFETIRKFLCTSERNITEGKMMRSPAIHYKNKVFAFFSTKDRMVFKLGKVLDLSQYNFEILVFNPFKNKGPLTGWYEVDYINNDYWEQLAQKALEQIQKEVK